MTAVILSRPGTDIVDLSVNQRGSNETTVILKDTLLDGARDYHFAVTELSVPLTMTSMFGYYTEAQELFTIQRRNIRVTFDETTNYGLEHADILAFEAQVDAPGGITGAQLNVLHVQLVAVNAGFLLNGGTIAANTVLVRNELRAQETVTPLRFLANNESMEDVSTYSLNPGRKFFDTQQFVKSLVDFGKDFNQMLCKYGHQQFAEFHHGGVQAHTNDFGVNAAGDGTFDDETDYGFLTFFVNSEGNLVIRGDNIFWDNYMIKFSNLGVAILGQTISSLTQRTLTFTGDVLNAVFINPGNNQLVAGVNTADRDLIGLYSLFQTAECRIKVSVESHLPTQSTTEIRDEEETNNKEIASAFFLNNVQVSTRWDEEGTLESYTLESTVFSGQFPLIHQNSRIKQWNRLLTAYNLQFFRFFVNIHYRVFNELTSAWGIKIQRMNIDENDYWSMKLRFVSDE